ncbi:MAG: M23 family metallopeptidase [Thermoanaerobaculia bacterium]
MQHLWAIRAALFALILGLVWPAPAEAEAQKKSPAGTPRKAPGSLLEKRAPIAKVSKPAGRSANSTRKRRAKRIIRQDADNRVVLEWIAEVRAPQFYGPFLPTFEPHDYPPAPCEPVDIILEAHLHDENLEVPEAQASEEAPAAEEAVLRQSRAESVLTVAKRIGYFLRPKSASARVSPEDVDLAELLSAGLRIPVEGVDAQWLRDSFLDRRGRYRKHLAIDIGAPRGTPVLATADGEVVKLRREKRGGITIYQKDTTGKYLFFYCHLSRYAKGLSVGQRVAAGDVIGYVGSTGRVIGGAHLHFSITRVPDDDDVREGLAVNPYLLFLAGVP